MKVFTTEMKVTGPAGQQKMNCCGPNWPDCLRNARGPAGTYPMSSPGWHLLVRSICLYLLNYSRRPSDTVFHEGWRRTVEVCVELTFQNGSQNKRSSDMCWAQSVDLSDLWIALCNLWILSYFALESMDPAE